MGRIIRAEFLLNLQTNREEQLPNIDDIQGEQPVLSEKASAETKKQIKEIRVGHQYFSEETRTA